MKSNLFTLDLIISAPPHGVFIALQIQKYKFLLLNWEFLLEKAIFYYQNSFFHIVHHPISTNMARLPG